MSPLYEFHCQACGHKFEMLRDIKNRDMVSCRECGAKATRKMSVVNFSVGWELDEQSHLKGHKDNLVRRV